MLKVNKEPFGHKEAQRAKKRFEWLRSFLIVQFGFVHQIIGMMNKVPSKKIDTMGVRVLGGGTFELSYNPNFIESLTDGEATFVMYHEILHLVLHHCTSRAFRNRELGNIATDLAVNDLIPIIAGSCERPVSAETGRLVGVFVDEFRKVKDENGLLIYKNIKNKQTAEWYYNFLLNAHEDGGGKGNGSGSLKDGGEGNGSGSLKDGGEGNGSGSHKGWKEDEIADEKIRAKIDEISKRNTWGNISAGNKELIEAAQVKRINWGNLIRRFLGNLAWKDREPTRKRPNRRTGFIHPGYKKVLIGRNLVAIDTSGSISPLMLSEFLSVINNMSEYVPIDLLQFDAEVTTNPKPWDKKRKSYAFTGRGGTNFEPVMEVVKKGRYKSVIILTDGEASSPSRPRARVLWVLPSGYKPPVDWGQVVNMEE